MESTFFLQSIATMGVGGFLIRLFVIAGISLFAAKFLKGIYIKNFTTSLVLALVLSILNATIGWLLSVLVVPINFLTFGLFSGLLALFINAIIIQFADKLLSGFSVNSIWWALAFALILSVITGLLNMQFGVSI